MVTQGTPEHNLDLCCCCAGCSVAKLCLTLCDSMDHSMPMKAQQKKFYLGILEAFHSPFSAPTSVSPCPWDDISRGESHYLS